MCLSIITISYSVLLLLVVRAVFGVWRSYSAVTLTIFVISIYVPLAATANFYVSGLGVLSLCLAGFLLMFGCVVGFQMATVAQFPRRSFSSSIFNGKDLKILWVFGIICGGASVLQGVDVIEIVGGGKPLYESLSTVALKNASDRYRGIAEPTILQSLLLSANYFSCLLAGFFVASRPLIGHEQRYKYIYAGIPIVMLLIFGLIQNTKASILYGAVLYISANLATRLLVSDEEPNYRLAVIYGIKGLVVLMLVFFLMVLMQSMRYGVLFLDASEIYTMLVEYALGHVSGFQYWFDHYYVSDDLLLGTKSFGGVTNLFGDSIQGGATLLQNKYIGFNFITNLDTAFSDLIMDFGVLGALFFIFLTGVLIGFLDLLRVRNRVICVPIFAAIIAFYLWFFTASIYNYSSIVLSLTLFFVYIMKCLVTLRPRKLLLNLDA